jgi:hypothetical protein
LGETPYLPPPLEETPPPARPALPFRLPAEYYAAPERPPAIFPRAVPLGCGTASLVFLIVFFAGGAVVSRGGGGVFMDWLFGKMQSEIDGQFTKDVPAAQRAEFDARFHQLRARIKNQHADFKRLQPLLRKISETTGDNKVTPDEAKSLTDALRDANK